MQHMHLIGNARKHRGSLASYRITVVLHEASGGRYISNLVYAITKSLRNRDGLDDT